jgi:hypothetical protein
MSAKMALIALTTTMIFAALVTSSLAGKDDNTGDRLDKGGAVVPCSLAGINPAYHPEIFGNPGVAQSYGFVRSPNGTWQVRPGCYR